MLLEFYIGDPDVYVAAVFADVISEVSTLDTARFRGRPIPWPTKTILSSIANVCFSYPADIDAGTLPNPVAIGVDSFFNTAVSCWPTSSSTSTTASTSPDSVVNLQFIVVCVSSTCAFPHCA